MTRRLRLACGGIFTPDPEVPATHDGLHTCRCKLVGKAGDAHHNPDVADVPDVQQRAAGEGSE